MEHLAGAFTVAAGDERGVRVNKAALVKEFVDGICRNGTDTEGCVKGVGSGAQMRDGTQIFQRVTFFLQRIVGSGSTFDLDDLGMDLARLFRAGGQDQFTGDTQSGTNVAFGDLFEIGDLRVLKNHLQIIKAAAVVELDKAQRFGIADGFRPAANGDSLVGQRRRLLEYFFQFQSCHEKDLRLF